MEAVRDAAMLQEKVVFVGLLAAMLEDREHAVEISGGVDFVFVNVVELGPEAGGERDGGGQQKAGDEGARAQPGEVVDTEMAEATPSRITTSVERK